MILILILRAALGLYNIECHDIEQCGKDQREKIGEGEDKSTLTTKRSSTSEAETLIFIWPHPKNLGIAFSCG